MSTLVTNNIQNLAGTASTSADNVINGSAKAWVKFSVNTSGTVTVNGNFNISSVTRTAQGRYTFTMTTALANANYSVVTSQGLDPTNGTGIYPILFWNGADATPTTSSFVVQFAAPSTGGAFDPKVCGLVVNV
jgi:hypothetical protein